MRFAGRTCLASHQCCLAVAGRRWAPRPSTVRGASRSSARTAPAASVAAPPAKGLCRRRQVAAASPSPPVSTSAACAIRPASRAQEWQHGAQPRVPRTLRERALVARGRLTRLGGFCCRVAAGLTHLTLTPTVVPTVNYHGPDPHSDPKPHAYPEPHAYPKAHPELRQRTRRGLSPSSCRARTSAARAASGSATPCATSASGAALSRVPSGSQQPSALWLAAAKCPLARSSPFGLLTASEAHPRAPGGPGPRGELSPRGCLIAAAAAPWRLPKVADPAAFEHLGGATACSASRTRCTATKWTDQARPSARPSAHDLVRTTWCHALRSALHSALHSARGV